MKISYWGIGVCHLCGEKGHIFIDSPEKGNWYKCSNCESYFQSEVNPIFNFEERESKDKWNERLVSSHYISQAKKIIALLNEGKSIIDVGCGTGWLTELIGQYGTYDRIVGTDLPNRNILIEHPKVEIRNEDFEIDGIPNDLAGRFDYVINYDVIEHVKYPTKWFDMMKKLLKENGKIYGTFAQPREIEPKLIHEWRLPTVKGMECIIKGFKKSDISSLFGRFILEF